MNNYIYVVVVLLLIILYYIFRNDHEETPSSLIKLIGDDYVFVDFYAPWCGYCKKLEPEFNKLIEQGVKGITITKFNADSQVPPLGIEIKSFPTLILFRGGRRIDYDGDKTVDAMTSWLKSQIL